MKVKEWLDNLNELVKENPEVLEWSIVTADVSTDFGVISLEDSPIPIIVDSTDEGDLVIRLNCTGPDISECNAILIN